MTFSLRIKQYVLFLISFSVWMGGDGAISSKAETMPRQEGVILHAQGLPAEGRQVRVGVAGEPPSVIITAGEPSGIVVEYWQELAQAMTLNYQLVVYATVEASLAALDQGDVDLVMGSISITSDRIAKYDFTQPISQGDLTVLLPSEPPTLWSTIQPFLGWAFLSSVGGIFLALFVVGNLLWWAEHNRNEEFPKTYWRGIREGMWCATVTFTTVGYGDRVPITPLGRTIAAVWMILSLVVVTSLTAGIATTLAVAFSDQPSRQFSQPHHLAGARIAAVDRGSAAERWAQFYQARVSVTEDLEAAIDLLESQQVDGVVYARLPLEYYLHQHPQVPYQLASFSLGPQPYGIALPLNSPLTQELNQYILQLPTQINMQKIRQTWFQSLRKVSGHRSDGDSSSP